MSRSDCALRVALLLAALLVVSSFLWAPVLAQDKDKVARPVVKWEYKVIQPPMKIGRIDGMKLEETLNKSGEEGWEYVGMMEVLVGGDGKALQQPRLICKRPLQK